MDKLNIYLDNDLTLELSKTIHNIYLHKFNLVNDINRAQIVLAGVRKKDYSCYDNIRYIVVNATNSNHIRHHENSRVIDLKNHTHLLSEVTSTAEHTFFLILYLFKMLNYKLTDLTNFKRPNNPGYQLRDKTIGIIGFGRVGKQIAEIARSFKMKTLIHDNKFINATPIELFSKSDIITVHVSIDSFSKPVINEETLKLVKDNSFIVNTSRGEAIEEEALLKHIPRISGFAADVLSGEPEPPNLIKFLQFKNVYITPHMAGYSIEALKYTSDLTFVLLNKELGV